MIISGRLIVHAPVLLQRSCKSRRRRRRRTLLLLSIGATAQQRLWGLVKTEGVVARRRGQHQRIHAPPPPPPPARHLATGQRSSGGGPNQRQHCGRVSVVHCSGLSRRWKYGMSSRISSQRSSSLVRASIHSTSDYLHVPVSTAVRTNYTTHTFE